MTTTPELSNLSRRALVLGFAAGSLVLATRILPATAQEKMSQADAKYQVTPKGDQRCDSCMLFQSPNACKVVQGEISPSGWCQLFVKKT